MDTRLKNILWEGEEVRWSGRPKPFSLFDHDSKNSILLTWIVSALVLAAVIVLMVFSSITGTRSFTDVLIMAIVALFLPVALSARPFMDKKCLEKNTLYAITNFRIIVLVKGEVMYLPLVKGSSPPFNPTKMASAVFASVSWSASPPRKAVTTL